MAPTRRTSIHTHITGSEGSVVIIVMMFILVILALGVALFSMVKFSLGGTELERKEVKAFNVAEAGIDSGMRALKLQWPSTDTGSEVDTQDSLIKSTLQTTNPGLYDPTRSDASEFIDVKVYDNVDADGNTTTVPYPDAPTWDSNLNADGTRGDGRMFVDSRANVDDDRHRILVLTQREKWNLDFPVCAMYASEAGANGQGLRVRVDPNQTLPLPTNVIAYYQTLLDKGINDDPPSTIATPTTSTFDDLIRAALINALAGVAQSQGTYYDDDGSTAWPPLADGVTLLKSVNGPGKIIYMKSSTPIVISGNAQLGSRTNPIVLILDHPGINDLDFRGTADFFGIIVTTGSLLIRGTSSFWGQVLAKEAIDSKGGGSSPEVNYNLDIINLINGAYTISVAIVPNTWEEYTVAQPTATTAP